MRVSSKDPRKVVIVAALKRKSGARKVTQVQEHKDGTFSGHCLKGIGNVRACGYDSLGIVVITKQEVWPYAPAKEKVA